VQELGASVEKGSFEKGMSRILEKGRENNKQHQRKRKQQATPKRKRERKGRAAPKKQAPIDYGASARCANGPNPGLLSCPVSAGCHGSSSAPHKLWGTNQTVFCDVPPVQTGPNTIIQSDSKDPRFAPHLANTYCGKYCKQHWGGNLTW